MPVSGIKIQCLEWMFQSTWLLQDPSFRTGTDVLEPTDYSRAPVPEFGAIVPDRTYTFYSRTPLPELELMFQTMPSGCFRSHVPVTRAHVPPCLINGWLREIMQWPILPTVIFSGTQTELRGRRPMTKSQRMMVSWPEPGTAHTDWIL